MLMMLMMMMLMLMLMLDADADDDDDVDADDAAELMLMMSRLHGACLPSVLCRSCVSLRSASSCGRWFSMLSCKTCCLTPASSWWTLPSLRGKQVCVLPSVRHLGVVRVCVCCVCVCVCGVCMCVCSVCVCVCCVCVLGGGGGSVCV